MPFLSQPLPVDPEHFRLLQPWMSSLILKDGVLPSGELPLEAGRQEGVLAWMAHCLAERQALQGLPETQQQALKDMLRRSQAVHLDSEYELERLASLALRADLPFLVFKGHALARTTYAHPACRTTSDIDLLVPQPCVKDAQAWLRQAGYRPADPFVGTTWLAAQAWRHAAGEHPRFVVDLHWDCSNRMHFRHRLSFEEWRQDAQQVALGDGTMLVPDAVHAFVLACIHLAAMRPSQPIRLFWLLDLVLLLGMLDGAAIPRLVQLAARAHATEACLAFTAAATALASAPPLENALEALRAAARPEAARAYDRSLRWRPWDLAAYWGRLGRGEKYQLIREAVRWTKARRSVRAGQVGTARGQ